MKDTVQKKYKALQLRKSGLSYREISAQIGAPKATVASWVQWAPLTDYQKTQLADRLKSKQARGRFMAGIALKARRIYREKLAHDGAEADFKTLIADPVVGSFFAYGLGLYSGKSANKDETKTGRKNSSNFQFMTANEEKAKLMIKWIERFLKISEQKNDRQRRQGRETKVQLRVFVSESYRQADCEALWSRALAMPRTRFNKTIYIPGGRLYKSQSGYKGSLAITVSNINALRTVLAWQKLLIKYYKDTV